MASPTVPKFPFMILEGKRWSARLDVPKDVRGQIGQRVMKFSTGLTDPYQAYRKAEPVIAGWKRPFEATRGQRHAAAVRHPPGPPTIQRGRAGRWGRTGGKHRAPAPRQARAPASGQYVQ
jgi:hypothetical protein